MGSDTPLEDLPSTFEGTVRIGVIGGTGIQKLDGFCPVARLDVDTPWGKPASPITILKYDSSSTDSTHPSTGPLYVAFLSRHGQYHQFAPHEVPARANIAALRSVGVRSVVAFSAVGSLAEEFKPRDFMVPDQVIDRTKGIRPFTYFEGGIVGHVPFAEPFDRELSKIVKRCGHSLDGDGVVLHDNGTLICMEGPQFSTRAESNLYRLWGASAINMSVLPEAKLAREAELAYTMICMSTDYDCWRVETDENGEAVTESVTVPLVMGHMRANAENARRLVGAVLDELTNPVHDDVVNARHLDGSTTAGAAAMTAKEGRSAEAEDRIRFLFPDIKF